MKFLFAFIVSISVTASPALVHAEDRELSIDERLKALEERVNKLEEMVRTAVMGAIFGSASATREEQSGEAKKGSNKPDPEIEAYLSKIELYDLKARYYETYLESKKPGVEFKLRNTGDKTLTKVEVTVYFLDENGRVIAEEDYHPVNVKGLFSDSKPLRPNYIWQLERGKFYTAPKVPSEWKPGAVTAKVTHVEFLKE